jgi:hypothetical protein
MAVSSWPDSMLTVRLILTSGAYSSDVLSDLYGGVQLAGFHADCEAILTSGVYSSDVLSDSYRCVQLARFHADCEANPDLRCIQQ